MLSAARAESEAMLSAAHAESDSRVHEAEVRAAALAERRHTDEGSALREQLAAAHVSRDAALGEASGNAVADALDKFDRRRELQGHGFDGSSGLR